MKKALITGAAGQDGTYLKDLLLSLNYEIYGIDYSFDHLKNNELAKFKKTYEVDISNSESLFKILEEITPNEIYHLAAYHFSSQSKGNLKNSYSKFYDINLISTNNILEYIKNYNSNCKIFYASSCQVFGKVDSFPQTETTVLNPDSLYSISKVASMHLCNFYRDYHAVFSSVGILYNHESPLRNLSFITAQISNTAALASKGQKKVLKVRNINSELDWGSAKDYVEAMWLTLQQPKGSTYIISSGIKRSIKDFAKVAFEYVNLDYRNFIIQDKNYNQKRKTPYIGNNNKIKKICNWHPKTSFNEMVEEMVDSHINFLNS